MTTYQIKTITTHQIKTVYLAGPISGLTYDEARYGWRQKFESLMPEHIHCLSPMRGNTMLKNQSIITSTNGYSYADAAGETSRDFNDVKNCDLMVACFLDGDGTISGGTFSEYGIAFSFQVPIIGVGRIADPNLSHVMAKRFVSYRVGTLKKAAHITKLLLTPGI